MALLHNILSCTKVQLIVLRVVTNRLATAAKARYNSAISECSLALAVLSALCSAQLTCCKPHEANEIAAYNGIVSTNICDTKCKLTARQNE